MNLDISADDIRARIQEALLDEFYGGETGEASADDSTRDAANSIWVCDLFPVSQTFVYSDPSSDKYRRGYSISAGGIVSLAPDKTEVQRATTYEAMPAGFNLARFGVEGDFVTRRGKVFEVGYWPDKGFSLTPAEADNACATFVPVENDLEHLPAPGILGHSLGSLKRIWREGRDLLGEITVPKWLDGLIGSNPLQNSLAWDKRNKRVVGNALTLTPRIADTALMAAYAKFAGSRHSKADAADIQALHDLTVKQGATCLPSLPSPGAATGQTTMSTANAKLLAHFRQNPDALTAAGFSSIEDFQAGLGGSADISPDVQARLDSLDAQTATFAAQLATQRNLALSQLASEFARQAIEVERVAYPREREDLIHLFTMAANADGSGTATFSDSGALVEGVNLKWVRASLKNRPKLGIFTAQLDGAVTSPMDDRTARAQASLAGAIESYNGGNN